MNRHIYTLKKPASVHRELWREALPLGNGLTGVLMLGCIGTERIHFNRHDLWEGGKNAPIPNVTDAFMDMRASLDKGDYTTVNQNNLERALKEKGYQTPIDCPHPLGWLDIYFQPQAVFKKYVRGVNMQTGEAFVEFTIDGCRYRRTAFVSRDADVTVMRMSADKPFTSSYAFNLYNKVAGSVTTNEGFHLFSENNYTEVQIQFIGDYTSSVNGTSLSVTGSDYIILIKCASHGSTSSLESVKNKTYAELLDSHIALHKPLYDKVSIELANDNKHLSTNEELLANAYENEASPALLERLWRFGRYLFISASSSNSNPVPLYGLWHGAEYLAWSQFVANENVQITYWHALAGGLSYTIPPLLRYYTSKIEKFRECAKQMFGARGIWISAYTTPNAYGVSIPVAIISNWISCAGWLCRHFWEYYVYTKDEKLLREEILPFMYESAQFYRDYAVEDGNYIRLYPAISPENTPRGNAGLVSQNATMDFAIMKELLTNLIQGITITGIYVEELDSFRQLLSKIPPYSLNEDGAVKEWMHDSLKDNYYHRHLSHIYPVFPGNEITAQNSPQLFKAFKKAVELRQLGSQSGWSLAHMANIYARMNDGEKAVEFLDCMAKSVVLDSLFTVHNDWRNMGTTIYWKGECHVQLDACFGAVNAIQEMLFCWQKDSLSILPALPSRLPSGSVKGLVFPEGTLNITWKKNKSVVVEIFAQQNFSTNILVCGKKQALLVLNGGETKKLRFKL